MLHGAILFSKKTTGLGMSMTNELHGNVEALNATFDLLAARIVLIHHAHQASYHTMFNQLKTLQPASHMKICLAPTLHSWVTSLAQDSLLNKHNQKHTGRRDGRTHLPTIFTRSNPDSNPHKTHSNWCKKNN